MNKFVTEICSRVFNGCDTSSFRNKNILITGANGLIGGILSDFFIYLNENHSYNLNLVLSSLSKNPDRIKHLLSNSNVKYINKDLSSDVSWKSVGKIDYCFYCAGYGQPFKFLEKNMDTFFINSTGVYDTFKTLFEVNKKAKCLYVSSAEVYALNENTDSHREVDDISISYDYKRNFYLMGKLSGELMVNNFCSMGYDAKSIRLSAVYGPCHSFDDCRVLSDLSRKGIGDKEYIDLLDEGNALRRYLHLSDLLIMFLNISISGRYNLYNVSGGEEISIYDMACYIGNFFEKDVKKGKTLNKNSPNRVWVSLDRYKDEFEDVEFLSFEEGMNNYLNWFTEEFYRS
jgi:UDP-glucuronate decarboxylase